MEKDLSSTTILVLVVLTLVVSFISTWISFTTTLAAPQEDVQQETVQTQFVLEQPVQEQQMTGMVAFVIEP